METLFVATKAGVFGTVTINGNQVTESETHFYDCVEKKQYDNALWLDCGDNLHVISTDESNNEFRIFQTAELAKMYAKSSMYEIVRVMQKLGISAEECNMLQWSKGQEKRDLIYIFASRLFNTDIEDKMAATYISAHGVYALQFYVFNLFSRITLCADEELQEIQSAWNNSDAARLVEA